MIDLGRESAHGELIAQLEQRFRRLLTPEDERGLDVTWDDAQRCVSDLALRPAKRIRPLLLLLGYRLVRGDTQPADGIWTFAAGLEALHTFLLVHDDVADASVLRRGGPTLHHVLEATGPGEDLAVVAGDHLFARALELMLSSQMEETGTAVGYYLRVCRHTAIGQFLDLALSRRPLGEISPFEAIKVCRLKTAKYSFAAPLACGAILAGAGQTLTEPLERIGTLAGVAFQLRDDLNGIFGDASGGKPGDLDLVEGKRTFPLLVAYRRATAQERQVLEELGSTEAAVDRARAVIARRGGVSVTARVVNRTIRAAIRAARKLALPPARTRELETFLRTMLGLSGPSPRPGAAA